MLEFDGSKLKRLREQRKMSRSELAMLVGKENQHIWNYENAGVGPPSDVLLSLMAIFGVQATDLSKSKEAMPTA